MGTINYKTSRYITMAFESVDVDKELFEVLQEESETYGGEVQDYIDAYIKDTEEADFENVRSILETYSFRFFSVSQDFGYYDGSQIIIEKEYAAEDEEEQAEELEEIEALRMLLHECNGVGMRACSPHWCTAWKDFDGTADAIENACDAMRKEVEELELEEV